MSRRDYPLLRKIYLNWDALNNGWNQYVLGYDKQRQMDFLSRLAGKDISWQDLVIAMMACLGLVALGFSYFLLRGKRVKVDQLQRLYNEFLGKLKNAGLKRHSHEGPMDFSHRAANRLPARAGEIERISQLYADLRYRSNPDIQALDLFRRLVKNFRNT